MEKLKKILNTDIKDIKKNKKKSNVSLDLNKFISKKLICFDMGSKYVKVIVGRKKKNELIIYNVFKFETPNGIINDGRIINSLGFSLLIKKSLEENNIKLNNAVCVTNGSSIINRDIIVPKTDSDDEMETLINFEIQQYLPLNMNDYVVQYQILDEITEDERQKCKVLVVTYPSTMAKEYLNILKESNLKPYALDVTFNAIKKLYNNSNFINGEAINENSVDCFIDMGNEKINVSIYKDKKFEFTRMIKLGGQELDLAISKEYGISPKEAEENKIKYGNLIEKNSSDDINKFNLFLRDNIKIWAEEIQRIIQFYKNKKVGNKIDNIYIYGGSSRINGMDRYLKSMLQIQVSKIKSLDNIKTLNNQPIEDLDIYLNALASIIRI